MEPFVVFICCWSAIQNGEEERGREEGQSCMGSPGHARRKGTRSLQIEHHDFPLGRFGVGNNNPNKGPITKKSQKAYNNFPQEKERLGCPDAQPVSKAVWFTELMH